jgi:hypothetical protein|tara:strand:- start:1247 stop:1396 length:150 start_codon:yes stop_codon:yes gene_type:complete
LVKKKQKVITPDWKDVDWDLIQRMRFVNADQEIVPPKDKFTKKFKKTKE